MALSTTTSGGGSTTSFGNTPQAVDDLFLASATGLTEDSVLALHDIVYLNVMANDLGGNAKMLWSIDDGLSAGGTRPVDLLTQDTARAESTSADTSLNGAKIWITADGSVGYDASSLSAAFKLQIQQLGVGEYATDSFTYSIRLGNGTLSWATATVQFSGINDPPTIVSTSTIATGSLTEDSGVITPPGVLKATGNITFADVELHDTHTITITPVAGNTLGGTLTATLVSDSTNNPAGTGNITWAYTVANGTNGVTSPVQSLAAGQAATEKFTVTINDGHGGTVTQTVTITILGTNDAPTISAHSDGAVTEDVGVVTGHLSTTGTITFADVDKIDTHTVSAVADAGNTLGGTLTPVISTDATGGVSGTVGWTYSVADGTNGVASPVQSLAAGQTATEKFTVSIADGHGGSVDQLVTITVTGTNDVPTISAHSDGAVTEDVGVVAGHLSTSGSISFNDVDLIDVHSTSVTADAGNTLGGTLTMGAVSELASTESGTVGWTYSVADDATDYLAAGQTAVEKFTVSIADGHGGSVDQLVTITVTGSNEAPTISAADATGSVTEDASSPTLSTSGSISFNDVDLIDVHSTSVTADAGNTLGGTLTMGAVSELASTESGTVGWTYSVADDATDYLAAGQTAVEKFTVTIADGHGGTVDQLVTITVTGSNEAPTISAADATGSVTEDASSPTLSTSGSISFNDVDLIDVHSTSVTADAGNTLGGTLTMGAVSELASTESGTVGWTYSVADDATDYLAAGQTAVEKFTVTIDDGHGGTVDQLVTITVTGSNEAPTITAADATGSVTEDASSPTLSTTGSISFNDVDLIDVHSTSVTADAGNTLGGTLTMGAVSELASTESGTVGWTYSVADDATDYLAAGQTAVEKFTVTIDDGHGGTVDQLVTITVTGSNENPVVTAHTNGTVTEDSSPTTLTDSGTVSFTDVDLTDTHTAGAVFVSSTYGGGQLGTLSTGTVTDTTGTGTGGSVAWNYSVSDNAVDFLAAGQTITETYKVTVSDNHGGSAIQNVTVVITGTNEAPDIHLVTTDSATATLTETNAGLTSSGTLTVTDVDLSDTVSSSVTTVVASGTTTGIGLTNAQLLSMFSVAPTTGLAADSSDTHNLSWNFNSGTQAFDYLASGQSLVLTYTVQSTDNNAASDKQTVTVTINGTNDAAIISGTSTGSVTEAGGVANAIPGTPTATGTLTDTDVDNAPNTFQAVAAGAATDNHYGTYAMTAGGTWTYTLDNSNASVQALNVGGTLSDTFTVHTADGTAQVVTVTINGTDDAPVIAGASNTIGYTEQAAAVVVDSGLTVTDIDNANLASAKVTISGGFQTGDVLAATTTGTSITASYSAATHVLTLSGIDTLAHYQQVLDSVTFVNTTNDNPTNFGANLTRTISWVANDGTFDSNTGTSTINITAVNDAPTVSSLAITETSISFVASDPDNATLSLASPFATAFGNPSITSGATTNLTPAQQGAAVTGTLQVTDGSATASVVGLFLGSGAGESFTAGATDTAIYGFGGNDTLTGGSGADWIFGGAGNDTIVGAQNDRLLDGGTNSDTLNVGASFASTSDGQIANIENVLLTSAVTLNLTNQTEGFNINGSAGADTIIGGSGNDTINGQAGNDTLTGNGGADQFRLQTNGGAETITDYTDNTDKIGFRGGAVTGGVGFANTVGSSAGTTLNASDYQSRASINQINNNDDNHVDMITAAQTTAQITTTVAGTATNTYAFVFNSTTSHGEIWFDTDWSDAANRVQVATLNNVTTVAQLTAITNTDIVVYDNTLGPAGIAGSPINLALGSLSVEHSGELTLTLAGIPADWVLNGGTNNGDGSWTIQTSDPSALTIMTPTNFAGAMLLTVNYSWTNVDGSTGSAVIGDNVAAYATGSPIYAVSADDHLTGSSSADLFVFAQPIAADTIHNFDVAADKIDLIGFTGVNGYTDLSIVNDANGNAVITTGADQTITLLGVDSSALGDSSFVFNQEPVMSNTGTMTIADGAILPLGGVVDNTGTIVLDSTGNGTHLEVLVESAKLQGGGQVILSDDSNNVIYGGAASATLINEDNTISGAGHLGDGQMTLVNSGTILANGTNALAIDTGANIITNSGTLEATGSGGLTVYSNLLNTGDLWANGGNIAVHGEVSGSGSATFDGTSSIEFDGASSANVTLDATATGTLILDNSAGFTGTVAGMNNDDVLDLKDVIYGSDLITSYTANLDGTSGTLTVSDGTHVANVQLVGSYAASGFHVNTDVLGGTLVTYTGPVV